MIGNSNPDELFFRVLLFKIFNRTETWELLEHTLGEVRFATYDFGRYDSVLSNAMAIHWLEGMARILVAAIPSYWVGYDDPDSLTTRIMR